MELKLYLYIEPSGIDNWYCYESFDEFCNTIVDDWYDHEHADEYCETREEIEEFINTCPYIGLYEVLSDSFLEMFIDDNKEKTKTVLVSDFIKKYSKGYIGEDLFEIYGK